MKAILKARMGALLFCLPLAAAFAQTGGNSVEERVTYDDGAVSVCGEGDGLAPCGDADGQTVSEEIRGPDVDSESENELAAEAARVRAEDPAQLDHTIGELEQGYNPDTHATEGLPH